MFHCWKLPLVSIVLLDSTARSLPADLRIVDRTQSPLGLLEVIEDASRGVRLLRADHSVLGGSRMDRDAAIFSYLHALYATTPP